MVTDRATFIERADVLPLLQECIARGTFGQLYFPSSNYPCGGNLTACNSQRVEITLDSDTQAQSLSMFGLCSLYFLVEGRAYLGLSRLLRITKSDKGAYVAEVETPSHMSSAEPRSSDRLPVPQDCDFTLYIYHENKLRRARPINVSLGGMLLDFDGSAEGIDAGSIVQVQGSWAGITLNVPALVRWVDGNQCGVFFKTASRRVYPPASPELLAIVEKLLQLSSEAQAA